jgi:hypothetical protein
VAGESVKFLWVWIVLVVVSQVFATENNLRQNPLYHVGNRAVVSEGKPATYGDPYLDQIQPLLSARCVACHGCFEAPCQLNLQTYEGLRRGFNPKPIYSSKRLATTYPSRMIDAQSIAEWRARQFLPVVDSKGKEPEVHEKAHSEAVMFKLLELGEQYNAAGFEVNRTRGFQQWLDAESRGVCVASDSQFETHFKGWRKNPEGVFSVSDFIERWPTSGMPFALPVPREQSQLKQWLASGAQGPSDAAQKALETPANAAELERWENFLNDRSHKGQQVGRYIYEHVFTAHILFKDNPGEFFLLVRSRTSEDTIDQIVTELPYDPPGGQVFYRFKKITAAITHKNHFLWELDDVKLAHLKKLFVDDWTTNDAAVPLPSYVKNGVTNTNPFENFESIPAMSRARFMIENSRIIVGAMTQGAVCVGTSATFAINDHFWSWFLKPESDVSVLFPKLGQANWDKFATSDVNGESTLQHFKRTVAAHAAYEAAYEITLREWLKSKGAKGLAVSDLWGGDGDPSFPQGNPNAWLNITRHERSATVQFGPEGGSPMSIWVMSYSNFERLYYNLVASFKEWGSVDHKAATWRHMSYVRIEGEDLAISMLPKTYRKEVRNRFARGVSYWRNIPYPQYSMVGLDNKEHFTHFLHKADLPPREAGTPNPGKTADEAIVYLVDQVRKNLQPGVATTSEATVSAERKDFELQLTSYEIQSRQKPGLPYARNFAHVVYLMVDSDDVSKQPWIYTLVSNRGYSGHNDMFIQKRTPEFDTFSVYRGFVGGYPNVFFRVSQAQRRAFIEDIARVGTKALEWDAFRIKWGIARNSPRFWSVFDHLHELKAVPQPGVVPAEQGIADLSQYEIFEEPKQAVSSK